MVHLDRQDHLETRVFRASTAETASQETKVRRGTQDLQDQEGTQEHLVYQLSCHLAFLIPKAQLLSLVE